MVAMDACSACLMPSFRLCARVSKAAHQPAKGSSSINVNTSGRPHGGPFCCLVGPAYAHAKGRSSESPLHVYQHVASPIYEPMVRIRGSVAGSLLERSV